MLTRIRKILRFIFFMVAYSIGAYCLYEYIGGVEGIRRRLRYTKGYTNYQNRYTKYTNEFLGYTKYTKYTSFLKLLKSM